MSPVEASTWLRWQGHNEAATFILDYCRDR